MIYSYKPSVTSIITISSVNLLKNNDIFYMCTYTYIYAYISASFFKKSL